MPNNISIFLNYGRAETAHPSRDRTFASVSRLRPTKPRNPDDPYIIMLKQQPSVRIRLYFICRSDTGFACVPTIADSIIVHEHGERYARYHAVRVLCNCNRLLVLETRLRYRI